MNKVKKAYEISEAKISFVSLVDKAANKRDFIIVKADDERGFTTDGKILKIDNDSHFVTGVVYEPMEEDAHGNFMAEEEIQKACYWFAKNGNSVDLQHNENKIDKCYVVENWVTKSDSEINGQNVKKGTWVMTVEVDDSELFDKIQKGEINGFSMGGVGKYSNIDTVIEKAESNKKGLFKQLANLFGFELVEKKDVINDNVEEEERLKAEDIKKMIEETVAKALDGTDVATPEPADGDVITKEVVQKMIDDAIKEALNQKSKADEPVVKVEDIVKNAVLDALEPIFKSRGLPNNLNDEEHEIEKSNSAHYLTGIL